jgi:hypothetical protein
MPPVLDPGAGDPIGLEELDDVLAASRVDARDEAAFASLGPWLARLGRNPRFLSDLAVRELESRHAGQAASAYGGQVLMLRPPDGRFVVRANFWPAQADAVTRASGEAAFFYDMAHDHNFPFLTCGYLGPGYWSDYYEWDGAADAQAGDLAHLRSTGRARLEHGQLRLYRAHRDVHVQLPPDAFSVSLNILGSAPGQVWRGQYRFDLGTDRVAEPLTTAPSEALAALAVLVPDGEGVLRDLMRAHPSVRMRRTALDALATAAGDGDARAALFEAAAGDRVLRAHALSRLDRVRSGR